MRKEIKSVSSRSEKVFFGLYSGVGADGIDAAAVAISGRGARMKVRQLDWALHPFSDGLRERIAAGCDGVLPAPGELAALDAELSAAFAEGSFV